jgi:hypothetical protein
MHVFKLWITMFVIGVSSSYANMPFYTIEVKVTADLSGLSEQEVKRKFDLALDKAKEEQRLKIQDKYHKKLYKFQCDDFYAYLCDTAEEAGVKASCKVYFY